MNYTKSEGTKNLCYQSNSECLECSIKDKIRCTFRIKDTFLFFSPLVFFSIVALYGMYKSGFLIWIGIYLIFLAIFYFVWENRILCSHCPYYAQQGRFLKCHTHYGFYKLWRYHPEPMSRSEQIQWLSGIAISLIYPLIFLILGNQNILFFLSIAGITAWLLIALTKNCKTCVHLSCPFNRVPEDVKREYLKQNKVMQNAWEDNYY